MTLFNVDGETIITYVLGNIEILIFLLMKKVVEIVRYWRP